MEGNEVPPSSEDATLPHLHPMLVGWFSANIGDPTSLQLRAWGSILAGENTLIVSPTGSGKTLAAVLPAISNLMTGRWPRGSVSVVYVSPMRALGSDLVKGLEGISGGLGPFPGRTPRRVRGRRAGPAPEMAPLEVGIRTGDVSQYERRKLIDHPPDILVTTPENLLLMLCSQARETLMEVSCVILDELHELASSKRGSLLSLTLELLSEQLSNRGRPEPVRVGLSATVRPERFASLFLAGYGNDGLPRPVKVLGVARSKDMEIEVRAVGPGSDPSSSVGDLMLDEVRRSILSEDGPVVVFQNTRKGAEGMSYALSQGGLDGVAVHHGSLGPEVRKRAEEDLKEGALRAIISSTSLELGVDIGGVDLVVQVSSPRSPTRLVQRFGRSGHGLERTSRGVILTNSRTDLMESIAVIKAASVGDIEPLSPPLCPPDVLAQFIVGASLMDEGIGPEQLLQMARRTYPFRSLRHRTLKAVISVLTERLPGPRQPAPRLRFDEATDKLRPNRDTRQAFYLNCGTIPRENNYKVLEVENRRVIGELSRDFAESLYERDVMMMASKSYRVASFSGTKVMVKEEPGALPTIPAWAGETPPRPFVVTRELHSLHRSRLIRPSGSAGSFRWRMDGASFELLTDSLTALSKRGIRPSGKVIPVERVVLDDKRTVHILHLPMGKRTTELFGRVLSYCLRRRFGAAMDHTTSDDGLAISSPLELQVLDMIGSLPDNSVKELARELVQTSPAFRSAFSACAGRSLLVLSRFRGRDTGPMYKRYAVERLLSLAGSRDSMDHVAGHGPGPVEGLRLLHEEALRESLTNGSDLRAMERVVRGLKKGSIRFEMLPITDSVSFLGASIIRGWRERVEEHGRELPKAQPSVNGPSSTHWVRTAPSGPSFRDIYQSPHTGKVPEVGSAASERYRRMMVSGGLEKVLRSVPFFTHPLDVLVRGPTFKLNELRSALKGGRLVPVQVCGRERMAHPRWANVVQLLSPPPPDLDKGTALLLLEGRMLSRAEVGRASGLKGADLKVFFQELVRSNLLVRFPSEAIYHIGAPEGLFPRPPLRYNGENEAKEKIKALNTFLAAVGPMTVTELARTFGWSIGQVPNYIEKGVKEGELEMFEGPPGPMEAPVCVNGGDQGAALWISCKDRTAPVVDMGARGPLELLTSKDPAIVLTGKAVEEPEREKARDSVPALLRSFVSKGLPSMQATVSERRDMVLFRDVSVDDYSLLGDAGQAVMRAIHLYGRLGYEVLCVERLMGVPAGESAQPLVGPLLDGGLRKLKTGSGIVLVNGAEPDMGLDRERVVREMLHRQGLLPQSRKRHPIEVLELLGGMADRWELLSRLGGPRYRKTGGLENVVITSRQKVLWDGIEGWLKCGRSVVSLGTPLELTDQMESLPGTRDLVRRWGLWKVMLDQPGPVWAFREEALRAPPPSPTGSVGALDRSSRNFTERLLSLGKRASSDLLMTEDGLDVADALLKSGLVAQDAWGRHIFPFDDSRFGRSHRKKDGRGPKGVRQRAWLLRCALSLGLFTMGDLIKYSPALDDACKVRALLNELSGGPLERRLFYDTGPVLVFGVPAAFRLHRKKERAASGTGLTILSPKDRMARVLMGDVRALLSRRAGFLVMDDTRCLSVVNATGPKKAPRSGPDGSGARSHASGSLVIDKVWMDLRLKRFEHIRDIKRTFSELGFRALTAEEGSDLEELYKEAGPSDDVLVQFKYSGRG